jgi:hypothetical protein
VVTGLTGGPPDSSMVLAAPPGLHAELAALVRTAAEKAGDEPPLGQAAE